MQGRLHWSEGGHQERMPAPIRLKGILQSSLQNSCAEPAKVGALVSGHTCKVGAWWAVAGVWRDHGKPALAWSQNHRAAWDVPTFEIFWSNVTVFIFSGCYNKAPQIGWHEQQKHIVLWFWRPKVQDEGVIRMGSLWKYLGRLCSLPRSYLLVVAGHPWSSLACRDITPVSASVFTWFLLYVCLSLCLFSSYKDTSHIGLRVYSTPVWPHLNSLHLQWPYFLIRSHSEVPGSTWIWGNIVHPNTMTQDSWYLQASGRSNRKMDENVIIPCLILSLILKGEPSPSNNWYRSKLLSS